MTGETLESIVSAVHYLSCRICGAVMPPTSPARWPQWTAACMATTAPRPRSRLRCTIWPAVPRAKPVHALLGEKKRSRMPLLGVIGGGDFDGDLRDAESKKAAGVTAYKIKVGIDTPENDAARTREICKVLGDGMLISADANQGYSVEQAAHLRARGKRVGPRFLRAAGRGG